MAADGLTVYDLQAACIDDPLGFVRAAFTWGEGELLREEGPDTWQADELAEVGRLSAANAPIRMATASGHGIGKTALVCWIMLWALLTRPGLRGVVTANTKSQLSGKTWAELEKWVRLLIPELRAQIERTQTQIRHVEQPATWFIEAVPWSKERSEAFAGLHAEHVLVIYDEASAVDDVIWEVSEGAMTTAGAMWFVYGNPTRNTGRFRECFGKFSHRWHGRRIDSRTARKADRAQIDRWIADYGEDSDFVRVRVKGEFPRAGSDQFIASDVVEKARRAEATSMVSDALVMGCDIARHGDDRTVLFFRRGRDARTIPPIVMRVPDLMQIAARIAEAQREHGVDAIFIDMGMGAGVVDRLAQLGVPGVIGIEFGGESDGTRVNNETANYANKRAEMWGNMGLWLKNGAIPDHPELAEDLVGPTYAFNRQDKIQLERKEDMKKRGLASPDMGDALALTFAYPVQPRGGAYAGIHTGRPGKVQVDYDPHADL